jgi:hypothetical protein
MKIFSVATIAAIVAFLPECSNRTDQRITDGVYREPSGIEMLTIKGRDITLQLNVTKGPRLGIVTGTYRYDLLKNGELRFGASSNDAFFVFTILNYAWIWNGKDIVRKHSETGATVVFLREGQTSASP